MFVPHAVRVTARKAISRSGPGVHSSLHPQAPVPGVRDVHTFSTYRTAVFGTHSVFTHSRTLLSRFFAHLLSPNFRIPLAPSLSGRALHTNVAHARLGQSAIKQGFSFPTRVSLSRPLGTGSFFPRAPVPATRVATNLGLGTLRKFTSARPLLQNLVENVPIAIRVLYEADIDAKAIQRRPDGKRMPISKACSTRPVHKDQDANRRPPRSVLVSKNSSTESATISEELDHYFLSPRSEVTTYLLVPLAPTPTSRMPLASSLIPTTSTGGPTLLHPLAELGSLHISHELHALRVSSLFSRLDHGDVWSKGVRCSAFAHGNAHIGDGEGTCTILKLEFVGWSKAEVKGVIGECGTGWCILHEEHDDELVDIGSDFSSESDEQTSNLSDSTSIDPAQSVILPTLDIHSDYRSENSVCSNGWCACGLSSQFLDRANL
ncbi:hypothetical protein AX15_004906 [Amanita polypyramis BW_CC]|nr:hypothetical protein AX15_004906 [Amanita polypyramis BW_CC]